MALILTIAIAVIQAMLAFAHVVLYRVTVSIFHITSSSTLQTLKVVFAVLALSFVAASLLVFRYNALPIRIFYIAAAVWLGFVLYLLLAAFLYWVAIIVCGLVAPLTPVAVVGKILLVAALAVGVYGLVHNRQMVVTSIKVQLPNLPAEWKGKKLVWVSDIHLGPVYSTVFLNRIVEKIEDLQPDMIFVGGDVYDGTEFPVEESVASLSKLRAPQGTFFITGNHEEFGDNSRYVNAIRAAGIKILNNELVDVHGLQVLGVDYNSTVKRDKFLEVLQSLTIDKSKPAILLKHAPTALDISANAGINLELSGHTHRAQMYPLNWITALVYKGYDYGLHYFQSMTVYTSSGVGTWGPPFRVGSPSEIVLIELY